MSALSVYFSNRVESLFDSFKKRLFTIGQPFVKRIVIVPSPAMKAWLMMRLADDPEIKVAAGVQIVQLDQLFQRGPSSIELSFCIEAEIREVAREEKEELWNPLLEYISVKNQISDQRVIALSHELAHLFQLYGKYGESMLQEWHTEQEKNWQQALWKKLQKKYRWPLTSELKLDSGPFQIHLFCLSHLSQSQHHLFTQLPQPVSYYLLSPCQHFWSDLTSYRENILLERKLSKANWENLEEYLRDCNPLLANFGRLGREMAKQIEESDTETHENYFLSTGAFQHETYHPLLTQEEEVVGPPHLSLLQAIQSDLLLLRNPKEKVTLREDRSVQIHSAPSLLREVQILHNHILDLIHREGISLCDVVVMAPDIMEYYPYIQMVFDETPLKYQINDVPSIHQSSLIQSFMLLLRLSTSRFDAHSVWQLFEEQRFQKKQKLTTDDLFLIQYWMKEARVLWGSDKEHKSKLLNKEMQEEQAIGTWEWAFERLLAGLAISHDEDFHALPIVETTEMELLGQWIALMRALRVDLGVCTDGTALTMKKWADVLQNLLETYFSLESLNEADEALLRQIETFRSLSVEDTFTFSSVFYQLEKNLGHKASVYREKDLNVIRFSSLLPMRAIPSEVVVLLGMQEGSFPKGERTSALDLLKKHPGCDYIPSQTDYDRYLFLEILLSARKCLLISFQGINSKDGEKQVPSLLVSELMLYCDRAYSIEGKIPLIEHPISPFDSRYFSNEKGLISHSEEHFRLAKAYYQKKSPSYCFIPSFQEANFKKEASYHVTLSQLKAFAKNPIRAYFSQTLGIYIKDENKRHLSEEPFDLTPLEKYQIRTEAFENDLGKAFSKAEKEGRLPFGVFKQITHQKLSESVQELYSTYAALGIDKEALFTIELTDKVTSVEREENHWKVPVLKLLTPSGTEVVLSGVLGDLCTEGLVLNNRDDRVDAIKVYPLLLVLSCLTKKYDLPVKPQLLLIKSGQTKTPFYQDEEERLADYLEYYLQGLQTLSPLIPEFTPDILRKESEELSKILSQKVNNPYVPFYNQELLWALQGKNLPDMSATWKGIAKKLYSDLLHHWYE